MGSLDFTLTFDNGKAVTPERATTGCWVEEEEEEEEAPVVVFVRVVLLLFKGGNGLWLPRFKLEFEELEDNRGINVRV